LIRFFNVFNSLIRQSANPPIRQSFLATIQRKKNIKNNPSPDALQSKVVSTCCAVVEKSMVRTMIRYTT
jgi:hypothetical protein